MSKPEHGFTINMTEGTLNITGQDYENLKTATLDLRVSGIHSSEIVVSVPQAKRLVRKALEHQSNPLEGYGPRVRECAEQWSDYNTE